MRAFQQRGFTLLEVLVVVSIIGILAALFAAPLRVAFQQRSAKSAAARFTGVHRLARSAALRFGRVAELHMDAAAAKFWVEVDTSSAGGVRDTIGTVHRLTNTPVSMSSTRTLLCFDARGLATTRGACEAPDAIVVFTAGNKTDTLQISALGHLLR